jgi:hypothetical protein
VRAPAYDVTTTPPNDAADFESFDTDKVGVRFRGDPLWNQLTTEPRALAAPSGPLGWVRVKAVVGSS